MKKLPENYKQHVPVSMEEGIRRMAAMTPAQRMKIDDEIEAEEIEMGKRMVDKHGNPVVVMFPPNE